MRSLSDATPFLPHFAKGIVIKGFGRGSKELGIPTANFPIEVVENLPKEIEQGVYYGYASIDNGDIHKMVMSIGWNPYYHNEHKSMETHIMHNFGGDFYGSLLKVCIIGYLRPEMNFDSLDALIAAIHKDITDAEELLEKSENLKIKEHEFFKPDQNVITNGHKLSNGFDTEINGHKNESNGLSHQYNGNGHLKE